MNLHTSIFRNRSLFFFAVSFLSLWRPCYLNLTGGVASICDHSFLINACLNLGQFTENNGKGLGKWALNCYKGSLSEAFPLPWKHISLHNILRLFVHYGKNFIKGSIIQIMGSEINLVVCSQHWKLILYRKYQHMSCIGSLRIFSWNFFQYRIYV